MWGPGSRCCLPPSPDARFPTPTALHGTCAPPPPRVAAPAAAPLRWRLHPSGTRLRTTHGFLAGAARGTQQVCCHSLNDFASAMMCCSRLIDAGARCDPNCFAQWASMDHTATASVPCRCTQTQERRLRRPEVEKLTRSETRTRSPQGTSEQREQRDTHS